MKRNRRTRKQGPVDEAPPRPELHPQLETVPDDVPGPSDGKSRKRPRSPDNEAPPSTQLRLHPQFDLLPDDLSDDKHRQLDNRALEALQRLLAVEYGFDGPPPPPDILLQSILGAPGFQFNPQYQTSGGLAAFVTENPGVRKILEEAWKDRTFKKIRNLAIFHAVPVEQARLDAAHKAWTGQWLGDSHLLLADLMDRLRNKSLTSYNHSLSIIQSSGMGKSRLMDSVAQIKFCFPFNLRKPETLPRCQLPYPPADLNIYDFFMEERSDAITLERKYFAFFARLFDCAVEELDKALNQVSTKQMTIMQRWHEYLANGATEHVVGNERIKFYDRVVLAAKTLILSSKTLEDIRWQAIEKGEAFSCHLLDKQMSSQNPPAVHFFIYFDEAHNLEREDPRTPELRRFHILERVLAKMNHLPFFVVFTTNSWQAAFPPPAPMISSMRDWSKTTLHAPFTELRFDTFADNAFGNLERAKGRVPILDDICTLDFIVKFGRPLWASLYEQGNDAVKCNMVQFAMEKLTCGNLTNPMGEMAALGVRVILDFDTARSSARQYEEKLVNSFMRVAYAVPEHREFLRGGAPSEPLLAEAAARVFQGSSRNYLKWRAPELLSEAFQQGLLERGERGEMIARLLWTLAHDEVISNGHRRRESQLQFSQPILVIDWLKSLLHCKWHDLVLHATPIANPAGPTLEAAFKNTYVSFTHFAKTGHLGAIGPDFLYGGLVRHMAFQCTDNQRSTDLIAPMLHGRNASICSKNTTPMYGRVTNGTKPSVMLVEPHIGGKPPNDLPILSIVHELGVDKPDVYSHHALPQKEPCTPNHLNHYQIHVEGCSNEVYAVIPSDKNTLYQAILGPMMLHDFARRDNPTHLDALLHLKPSFHPTNPQAWLQRK